MTTPLKFPFDLRRPRVLLMAPLRAEVVRAEQAVTKALALLTAIDGCEIGPFQDGVMCCIEGVEHHEASYYARQAARTVRLAARRDKRQGYDTWPTPELRALIKANEQLATTLLALYRARRSLVRAETAELARQKQATA